MAITIQILCGKNPSKIKDTLQSILPLEANILIGNCGDSNDDLDSLREYDCKIITFKCSRNEARNHLVDMSNTEWQFYLEPGEILSIGHDLVLGVQGKMKRVFIVHDGFVTKETRLWKKNEAKFVNPVYETLEPNDAESINIFITGREETEEIDELDELLKWKRQYPQSAEIDYYLAYRHLRNKDYNKFLKSAELFLFRDGSSSPSVIMTRYYLAQVNLYNKKNVHEAIRNLLYCLVEMPLMAEFWCLLGDCYYRTGVPEKAAEFFKIAKEMGRHRKSNDVCPVEFAKYGEYPDKMIKLCEEIKTTILRQANPRQEMF